MGLQASSILRITILLHCKYRNLQHKGKISDLQYGSYPESKMTFQRFNV